VQLYQFDDAYVQRLREGDRWTEEHFVRYFGELLLIKLRARLRSMDAVEDVRQEVFVRVMRTLRAPEGLRDGRKLGAFVNSVCNNVLLESYRAGRRVEPLEPGDYAAVADPSTSVDEALVTAESRMRVQRILRDMPSKDAEILRALFIEEQEKDDVCRRFGVDRNYLRVLLYRAKDKFRAAYERAAHETSSPKTTLRTER
jgi:RNA polymerase sigma-70 factor (ECF subfamily)